VTLPDGIVEHLREVVALPELEGTRYRMVRRLARGGMGTVYVVRDVELDREVALKVLTLADPSGELAARFRSEARVVAGLEHPGIVPVHDAGVLPGGEPYYAMKLVRGVRLDEWKRTAAPSLAERLRQFQKICEAVAFAHAAGVIHRDLKPANVMIGPFGEALVMDWGLATLVGRAGERPAGTPGFMAPEQQRGGVLDERTDVFGLGAILGFLVAGDNVPRRLDAVRAKATADQPSDRYPSAAALGADVGRFLDGAPVSAHRESLLDRTGRALSRYRTVVILVLAYLAMRLVVLFAARP